MKKEYNNTAFSSEIAIEMFGEDAREPVCNNLEEYCYKWRIKDKQIAELKRIIPTLPLVRGPISLRGLYEVMLPKMQQELQGIERHIRRLQRCLELLEGRPLFTNPNTLPGHIDVKALKERLDIVDVVSQWVELRHSGKTYKGRCPFHSECTPSFVVYPDSKSWHCFGACGESGDAISFVQKIKNCGFREAVTELERL